MMSISPVRNQAKVVFSLRTLCVSSRMPLGSLSSFVEALEYLSSKQLFELSAVWLGLWHRRWRDHLPLKKHIQDNIMFDAKWRLKIDYKTEESNVSMSITRTVEIRESNKHIVKRQKRFNVNMWVTRSRVQIYQHQTKAFILVSAGSNNRVPKLRWRCR